LKFVMDERGKKYLIDENNDFQSDLGIITKEQLKNSSIGDKLYSHLNKEFKIIKANTNDFIDLMDRRCSIIIQKDIGTVIAKTGIGNGDTILDAGTGAGAIALNFGNIVGKNGKVYSYEIREDFSQIASKNIDSFNMSDIIEVKNKDNKEGIDEDNLDLIFLDLTKPYEIFEEVYESLKLGGHLAVYAPYINQAEISYRIAKKLDFSDLAIYETLERQIEVKSQGTRPMTRMVGHSGYLFFARKL